MTWKIFATGLALLGSSQASTQELHGRVIRGEVGVGGVQITLHRVTRDTSGAVSSTISNSNGTFRLEAPPSVDSGFSVLFATAEWQGVRYFGAPLHPTDARDRYDIAVFDTISAGSPGFPIRLSRRDLILLPEVGNGWEVNEVVKLENRSARTVVAADGLPTFEFRIPENADAFEVGEAALTVTDVRRMGNRVLVSAPLRPGEHEVVVRYRIGRDERAFNVPTRGSASELNLLVRQPAPELEVKGMAPAGPENLGGETFQRFSATLLSPGAVVRVSWKDPSRTPVSPVVAAAGIAGLVLAGGTGAALRDAKRHRS